MARSAGQSEPTLDVGAALVAARDRERLRRDEPALAEARAQTRQAGGKRIGVAPAAGRQRRMASAGEAAHAGEAAAAAGRRTARLAGAGGPTGATGSDRAAPAARTGGRHHRPGSDGIGAAGHRTAMPGWALGGAAALAVARRRAADHRNATAVLRPRRRGEQRGGHRHQEDGRDEAAGWHGGGLLRIGPVVPGGSVVLVVHRRPCVPGLSVEATGSASAGTEDSAARSRTRTGVLGVGSHAVWPSPPERERISTPHAPPPHARSARPRHP